MLIKLRDMYEIRYRKPEKKVGANNIAGQIWRGYITCKKQIKKKKKK